MVTTENPRKLIKMGLF